MTKETRYWFPAKRFGWGWGPPSTWEGWLVLLGSLFTVAWAGIRLLPDDPLRFTLVSIGTAAAVFLVCLVKGEPPSWHWGDDN